MSSASEAAIIPAAAVLLPLSAVVTAVELGAAVAAQMQAQYEQALGEAQQRAQQRQAQSAARAAQGRQVSSAVATTVAKARVGAAAASTASVLDAGLDRLQARLQACEAAVSGGLLERLHALRQQAAAGADDPDLIARYHGLCAAVDEATAGSRPRPTAQLAAGLEADLDQLEADVLRDLAPEGGCLKAHTELCARVRELRGLVATQPRMVVQALAPLRSRLAREAARRAGDLAAQRARQEAERERQGAIRALACEIEARLGVVEAQSPPPAIRREVGLQRRRLADLAAGERGADEQAYQQLLSQARALFVRCSQHLQEQPATAYVVSQVADVLLTLGYTVSVLEGPPCGEAAYFVPLQDEVGVEVAVGSDGRLATELVSRGRADVSFQEEQQTQACRLLDDLLGALKHRDCSVRERYRRHLKAGDKLRAIAAGQEASSLQTSAPRYQQKAGD